MAQGGGRGGVAGDDHRQRPPGEQVVGDLLGKCPHLGQGALAVGGTGLVGQVDQVGGRQQAAGLPQYREPAHPGVKDADHGALPDGPAMGVGG